MVASLLEAAGSKEEEEGEVKMKKERRRGVFIGVGLRR